MTCLFVDTAHRLGAVCRIFASAFDMMRMLEARVQLPGPEVGRDPFFGGDVVLLILADDAAICGRDYETGCPLGQLESNNLCQVMFCHSIARIGP